MVATVKARSGRCRFPTVNVVEWVGEGLTVAVMLGNLYGALREAGVPDDKAQKPAEEVAGFKDDIASLKADVGVVK